MVDRADQQGVDPFASAAAMAYALPVTIGPMALLRGGVPLSLLMDLVLGPQSDDLLRWESETASEQPGS